MGASSLIILKITLSLLLALLFIGCSQHNYKSRSAYLITIKSKELRFSDMGFISRSTEAVLIDIFSLGNQILKLEIDDFVTLNGATPIPPSMFNSRYLHSDYPPETLKEIFLGKPIFEKLGLENVEDGFIQHIGEITYRVSQDEIYFKDKKNGVLIKLKRRI